MKKTTADKLKKRPMWTCPKCGNRFVTPNMWHSCGRWTLDHHFKERPRARTLYKAFLNAVKKVEPVRVVVSKSRIAFMKRMRFAGVTPRKESIRAGLMLTRQAQHPALVRVECFAHNCFAHTFEIREASDIDAGLRALIREAHAVGSQQHLAAPKADSQLRSAIARQIRDTGRSVVLFQRDSRYGKKARRPSALRRKKKDATSVGHRGRATRSGLARA